MLGARCARTCGAQKRRGFCRFATHLEKGPVAGPNLHASLSLECYFMPAALSAARTRAGVNGAVRMRTPVASKNALAMAAGVATTPSSPMPAAYGFSEYVSHWITIGVTFGASLKR